MADREEFLRGIISGRAKDLIKTMKSAASSTQDLRENMQETAAASSEMAGAMSTSEDQAAEYERTIQSLSRDTVRAAAKQEFMSEEIDDAGRAAMAAASQMQPFIESVEEAGDESAETAAEISGLEASMATLTSQATTSAAAMQAFEEGADVDIDETDVKALKSVISDIPDSTIRAAGTADELAVSLNSAVDSMENAIDKVEDMTTVSDEMMDTLIASSDSLRAFKLRLEDAGMKGKKAKRRLDGLGDEASELLDRVIASSNGMKELRSEMDDVGDEAITSAQKLKSLQGELSDTIDDEIAAATTTEMSTEQIEQLGDQATETAAETQVLSTSLKELAANALGAGVNFGPFSTSLKTMGTLLPIIIALVGSLTAALGGLAVAAAGAAGAFFAIFAGGLLGRAEQLKQQSAEIKSIWGGMEAILSGLGSSLLDAIEPLQRAGFGQQAMSTLDGLVRLVHMFSEAIARSADVLLPVIDAMGAEFWQQTPTFIASMRSLVIRLLPYLKDMAFFLLNAIPEALTFMQEEAAQLIPILGQFAIALIDVLIPLIEIGTAILSVVLPPLTALLEVLAAAGEVISKTLVPPLELLGKGLAFLIEVLKPILDLVGVLIGAFLVAEAALYAYAAASTIASLVSGGLATTLISSLIPALYALGTAVWSALGPIGVLIGAVVAIISYFGWWDDIARVLGDTLQWLGNVASDVLGTFLEIVGASEKTVENVKGISEAKQKARQRKEGDSGLIGTITDTVEDISSFGPSIGPIPMLSGIGMIMEAAPESTGSGGGGVRKVEKVERWNVTAKIEGDGGGMTETDVERAVERVLEKRDSRQSDT